MHHFAQPVEATVWQLAPLASPEAAQALQVKLASEPGVSACAVSPRTNCVAFVYHPEEATPEALLQAVGRNGARVINPPVNPPAPAIRQCPVPSSYIALLDKIRFTLNVRRFFISV